MPASCAAANPRQIWRAISTAFSVVGRPMRRSTALRSLVAIPSVLAFGAGFVPALMGDERALHDRLAHTRVVRA